jgi:hypothetical protein
MQTHSLRPRTRSHIRSVSDVSLTWVDRSNGPATGEPMHGIVPLKRTPNCAGASHLSTIWDHPQSLILVKPRAAQIYWDLWRLAEHLELRLQVHLTTLLFHNLEGFS